MGGIIINNFFIFMAIPIIAFHGVESIHIYIYVCVTCTTMCCIRT